MQIIIISLFSYPSGMSGTNRIASLAKGLAELGHQVKIFCLMPSEKRGRMINHEIVGVSDGVEFEYTAGTLIWPDSKLGKMIAMFRGYVRAIPLVRKFHRQHGIDCIIALSGSIAVNALFYVYSRIYRLKYLVTLDEYPALVYVSSRKKKLLRYLQLKYYYKMFDGMIIMTRSLISYYRKFARPNVSILHVPMTVDCERFANVEKSDAACRAAPYIAYCGMFDSSTNKDGIDILIKAFAKIAEKHAAVKLYLIGGATDREAGAISSMKQLVAGLNLNERVVFTGKVHRDQMPQYLSDATMLALARPQSLRAEGGFPTKLGEYLMTGNPVVVTAVGEIPDYLQDGVNAFIAVPGDIDSFAEKMDKVLTNTGLAKEVGLRGKALAMDQFNNKIQAERLDGYLKRLLPEKQ